MLQRPLPSSSLVRLAPALFALLTACGGGSGDNGDAGTAPRPAFTLEDLGLDALPACDHDDECASGRCEPRYGRCVDCLFDVECSDGSVCEDRRCVGGGACTSDGDCEGDPRGRATCDISSGRCVACLGDTACGDGEICEAKRCIAGERCVNSLDCSMGGVCDRARDLCVECLTNADCGEAGVCFDQSCRIACDGDRGCVDAGGLCATDLGFCVECVEDEDCPGDYHCDEGTCRVDACQQGEASCALGSVSRCSTDGRGFVSEGCVEQSASCAVTASGPACVPWVCTPREATCDPSTRERVVCANDGLSELSRTACASGTACEDGVCRTTICTPNATFCDGSTVRSCNARGTASILWATCGSWEVCTATPTAHCTERLCDPGSPACVDGHAGTCDATGLALVAGAEDCEASAQACLDGACIPRVCVPNETFCSGSLIRACRADGLGSTTSLDCAWSGRVCEVVGGASTCVTPTCTPNALVCDGSRLATCNATGTGFGPPYTECTGTNDACSEGQCRPSVCTPNGYFCEDDRLMRCNAGGTAATTQLTCGGSYHCDAAARDCRLDVCTASQMGCDGNATAMCNLDGSGFVGPRTECGSSTSCANGVCAPRICVPGAMRCVPSGSYTYIYRCAENGLSESNMGSCHNSSYACSAATGTCVPNVCSTGATRCNGSTVENCAADRLAWVPSVSCADTQQLCVSSACVAQQIETTTTTNGSFAAMDALRGHYVEVTRERLLVRFEASLRIANGQSRTLTWVVYESTSRNGPYAPIAQVTTTANGNGASQWYGSDPLNATLRAGRFYAIAVHAEGAVEYTFRNNVSTVNLSFGSIWSGVYENTSTPPATLVGETRSTYYGQRFTTAAAPP